MQIRCRFHSLSRLLLCVVLSTAVATPVLAVAKRMRGDSDWQTYRNERYAFRLSYPPDSKVETHRERGVQHVSISRGASEEGHAGYQVDVLIYDHRLGHKLKTPCRDLLREAHTVKVGKVQGLRGIHQQSEAESSGAHAVCVESRKLEIVVRAVETDAQTLLADRILDTLRFGE